MFEPEGVTATTGHWVPLDVVAWLVFDGGLQGRDKRMKGTSHTALRQKHRAPQELGPASEALSNDPPV